MHMEAAATTGYQPDQSANAFIPEANFSLLTAVTTDLTTPMLSCEQLHATGPRT